MADEAGIRIGGVLYPPPASYTLGEARTIKQMTDLELPQFFEKLQEIIDDGGFNSDVFAAFVWASMHHVDKSITPEYVDDLDFDAIVGSGAKSPPAQEAPQSESDSGSDTSASQSNGSLVSSSDLIPSSSGIPE